MKPLRRWGLWAALCCVSCSDPGTDGSLEYLRGVNAMDQRRHDWGRIYFRQDRDRNPRRLESLRSEGICWASGYQQSLTRATALFEQFLALQPQDAEIRLRLVRTLLVLGDQAGARRWAEEMDASAGSSLLRAEAWVDADLPRAQAEIGKALALDPRGARIRAVAARIEERAGNRAGAIDHALEATRLDPLDLESFYLLNRLWRQAGEIDRAREALEIHQLLSRLLHDGTRAPLPVAEQLSILRELEARWPTQSLELKRRRLLLLWKSGRIEDAEREMPALRSALDRADRIEIATLAGEKGRVSVARGLFLEVLSEEPTHRGAVSSLAILEIQAGDLEGAQRRLEAGLAAYPHFARYHLLIGRVATGQQRLDAALEAYREALRLAPWEWEWRRELVLLLRSRGAFAELRAVVAEAPEQPPGWELFRKEIQPLLESEGR